MLQVTVQMQGDYWANNAQYVVYVANPYATPVTNGWTVQLNMKPSVKFAWAPWNCTLLSEGPSIAVVKEPAWIGGGSIPAQGSVSFGGIVRFDPGVTPPFILSASGVAGSSPPPPSPSLSTPIVQPISNSSQSPSFTVSWSSSGGLAMYTLHQASDSAFTSGLVNYPATSSTSQVVTVTQAAAPLNYYFRVGAALGSVSSDLSNTVSSTVAAISSPPPPLVSGGQLVHSYWETWAPDAVDVVAAMKFDVVNVSFVRVTAGYQVDGLDCPVSKMQEFIQAVHAAGKKVKVSYGGWSFAYDVQTVLTSKEANLAAAQALAGFVKQYNLDGVDLDFESNGPPPALQIHFIQTLRSLLPSNGLLSYTPLTPTFATEPWKSTCVGAWQYLDSINPMCYNAYASYDWKADMDSLVKLGVPKGKLAPLFMPGSDEHRIVTSLEKLQANAQHVVAGGFAGIGTWDLNRDLSNSHGLGRNSVMPMLYSVIHS